MTNLRAWVLMVAVGLLASVPMAQATPPYQLPGPPSGGPPSWNTEISAAEVTASTTNGGFETGTFAGWTVVNQAGGSGDWYINSGTTSPDSGFTIPAPPEGKFNATTDQFSPGSHILYQDIALEAGSRHFLSFIYSVDNQNGTYFTPGSLDFTGPANQQFRIDIMDPTAPVASVAPGDVLLTLFQNQVGDPPSIPLTTLRVDISQFAGRTIRLRFAEVDNQFFLQAGVDAVQIQSAGGAPTLSHVGLGVAVFTLLLVGAARLARAQRFEA